MNCFFWHKWGKWSDPIDVIKTRYAYGVAMSASTVQAQRRTCEKCGKTAIAQIGR